MKLKIPPFEVWYFFLCLLAAVVLCGCSSMDGGTVKAVAKQVWYLNGLFADDCEDGGCEDE